MSRQSNALFLEKWLASISGSSSTSTRTSRVSSSSTGNIIQAWADLRDCLHSQAFQPRHLQSMIRLQDSQDSLYVADLQAKLLLSILERIVLPSEAYPVLLRLLYVWVMKSSRPSSMVIDSAAEVMSKFVASKYGSTEDPLLFSNAVLFLGALSYVPSASERSKTVCLDLVCRLLEEGYRFTRSAEVSLANILAGIGYALCSSVNVHYHRILDLLMGIWGKEDGPHCSIPNGLMVLHLVEWVVPGITKSGSQVKLETFSKEVLEIRKPDSLMKTSVSILVSFSCMEYFRRVRLPEYMDTIRGVVVSVQENEAACTSFVKSMPCYADLTNPKDFPQQLQYTWLKDEVQTSRILFYLRVIPTCIEHLPADLFSKVVTPTMFLYMEHPNGKIARASHSMFVAFVSLGKESDGDETASLKEQLAFYYVQKSLSEYPSSTPFDGMASGFAHLIQHLPAGSPAIFYCIHSLVEKVQNLCSKNVSMQNADSWKNWQGELEPCKKLFDMLVRFISLVDIQVSTQD
ncbi:hypothetical protein LINPERHAP1_LOCUS20426 [Linum perenne]